MAALKLPVMMCMICSCLGVTFPQRYERLHPVITQSLPQTIYQFLNQPQARQFLPQLTTNSVPSTSRDATTTTTTTTIRKKPKSLPTKPKLEPITQASFHPITIPGSQGTSSSYSSLGTWEISVPSTASSLLSTLRPNDIPTHPEKGSLKPDHFQRADPTRIDQSSGHSQGGLSSGGHSRGDQSSGHSRRDQSSEGHSRDQSTGGQSSGGQFSGNQSSGGQSRGDQSSEGQSSTSQSNGDKTIVGQSKSDHGTLFRSEVHPKTQHRLVDNQATSSRAATQQQVLFQASNNHDDSFQVPGNHEHSFSIINHGEPQGPQDQHETLLQIPNNQEVTFNFANNQQKFLGSASKHRTSRLTSASHSQTGAKNKKESRSDAAKTTQKLHQKRDFGATPKVFFEHPHHQAVFEEPHSGVFHHQLGGDALLHAGGSVGASHHDLSFGGTPHLLGGVGHAGHDYHHRPAKYDFKYVVRDEYGGNDFGHQESRSGHDTKGAYYVQLPDGRRQTVSYFVNKGSGFVAKVHYEGKAVHPQPKHAPHGIQSGAISHIPVHQLETFDHVPKGHNLHNSFAHGGVGETVFSLPTAAKFH